MRNISTEEIPARLRQDVLWLHDFLVSLAKRGSLRDPIAAACESWGLTPPQLHALMGLGHGGPLTMGELSLHAGVTGKTVTGVADRLERAGYLRRERRAEDRRVVHVVLTRSGRRIFEQLEVHMTRKIAELLALLEPGDRAELFRIFAKARDRFDAGAQVPRRATGGARAVAGGAARSTKGRAAPGRSASTGAAGRRVRHPRSTASRRVNGSDSSAR